MENTAQEIKDKIKRTQRYRADAKKIVIECDELLQRLRRELFVEELVKIARG